MKYVVRFLNCLAHGPKNLASLVSGVSVGNTTDVGKLDVEAFTFGIKTGNLLRRVSHA